MTAAISRLLDVGLALKPDDTALISPEGRWTWRGLEEAALRYASNLTLLGLKPGDRIASLLPNCDALIIHYLGCFKAGFVATPLNYRYKPPEIDHALQVSGARLLLCHSERADDIASSNRAGSLPLGCVWFGSNMESGAQFSELLREPSASVDIRPSNSEQPAAIFFTSGSTGPAKGVTHSAASLGFLFRSYSEAMQVTPMDVIIPLSSLSHIGAFLDDFAAMFAGAKLVIPASLNTADLLEFLREHRPTLTVAIPAILFALAQDERARPGDFSSFRLLGASGDAVPIELRRLITKLLGPEVNELYGMTEIGMVTLNPPNGEIRPGSVGKAIEGFELDIRNGSGTSLPAGEKGRLWVRSPGNFLGYWNNPEATCEVLIDGWLDTGDVMSQDGDDYFWFHGRQKQLIIHDGSNIAPQEVEDALLLHPAVALAGVVGVADLVHGENVRAFVKLKSDVAQPATEELIEFARSRVGYKAPESIIVLQEMPMTVSEKVDRAALRRMSGTMG